MKKFIFPSLLLLIMAILVCGCQGIKNNETAYDFRKDKNAPNYMSNELTGPDKGRVMGNDVTNQNPNFLKLRGTRNGNASGGSGNLGVDADKAKQVIADTKEFRTDSVWINGDRMWVNVYKMDQLTIQEKLDAQARLHRKLVEALPRYNIEVSVQEDRR
ncbi:hypothetical protein [Neobacillus massiliamazoniensis]|uniref:Sporulation protein n=1 Tax=Neobacillus massiliamazoniensis TaxID=1499688 RepID=A0A0U1NX68_9BACI|nr:hypothetical protein [Neobacillus massiliamazoniensis]CRK82620.1 hypothetical protein BN000_02553 [Neobacillus massiliamazoniensis]